eukprot:10035815-Alexandrium_andersonii.AAC.1
MGLGSCLSGGGGAAVGCCGPLGLRHARGGARPVGLERPRCSRALGTAARWTSWRTGAGWRRFWTCWASA